MEDLLDFLRLHRLKALTAQHTFLAGVYGFMGAGKQALISRIEKNAYLEMESEELGAGQTAFQVAENENEYCVYSSYHMKLLKVRCGYPIENPKLLHEFEEFAFCDGGFFVFNSADFDTFARLEEWLMQCDLKSIDRSRFLLVATYLDLATGGARQVPSHVAQALADELHIRYFEVSAKSSQGIKESMKALFDSLIASRVQSAATEERGEGGHYKARAEAAEAALLAVISRTEAFLKDLQKTSLRKSSSHVSPALRIAPPSTYEKLSASLELTRAQSLPPASKQLTSSSSQKRNTTDNSDTNPMSSNLPDDDGDDAKSESKTTDNIAKAKVLGDHSHTLKSFSSAGDLALSDSLEKEKVERKEKEKDEPRVRFDSGKSPAAATSIRALLKSQSPSAMGFMDSVETDEEEKGKEREKEGDHYASTNSSENPLTPKSDSSAVSPLSPKSEGDSTARSVHFFRRSHKDKDKDKEKEKEKDREKEVEEHTSPMKKSGSIQMRRSSSQNQMKLLKFDKEKEKEKGKDKEKTKEKEKKKKGDKTNSDEEDSVIITPNSPSSRRSSIGSSGVSTQVNNSISSPSKSNGVGVGGVVGGERVERASSIRETIQGAVGFLGYTNDISDPQVRVEKAKLTRANTSNAKGFIAPTLEAAEKLDNLRNLTSHAQGVARPLSDSVRQILSSNAVGFIEPTDKAMSQAEYLRNLTSQSQAHGFLWYAGDDDKDGEDKQEEKDEKEKEKEKEDKPKEKK